MSKAHVCECVQAPESVSGILKPVVALYAMKVTETNLAWYMSEGLLSTDIGSAVPQRIRSAPNWPSDMLHSARLQHEQPKQCAL